MHCEHACLVMYVSHHYSEAPNMALCFLLLTAALLLGNAFRHKNARGMCRMAQMVYPSFHHGPSSLRCALPACLSFNPQEVVNM